MVGQTESLAREGETGPVKRKTKLVESLAAAAVFGVSGGRFAAHEPIQPVQDINLAQVELGRKLSSDPRLSKPGFISCNSCHDLSTGGTGNLKTSIGGHWQQGPINAPTVLNSSLSVALFGECIGACLKESPVCAGLFASIRRVFR